MSDILADVIGIPRAMAARYAIDVERDFGVVGVRHHVDVGVDGSVYLLTESQLEGSVLPEFGAGYSLRGTSGHLYLSVLEVFAPTGKRARSVDLTDVRGELHARTGAARGFSCVRARPEGIVLANRSDAIAVLDPVTFAVARVHADVGEQLAFASDGRLAATWGSTVRLSRDPDAELLEEGLPLSAMSEVEGPALSGNLSLAVVRSLAWTADGRLFVVDDRSARGGPTAHHLTLVTPRAGASRAAIPDESWVVQDARGRLVRKTLDVLQLVDDRGQATFGIRVEEKAARYLRALELHAPRPGHFVLVHPKLHAFAAVAVGEEEDVGARIGDAALELQSVVRRRRKELAPAGNYWIV